MKRVPAKHRCPAAVQSFVTTKQRAVVERIARQEKVSISEIGRRAISEFVQRNVVEQQEA
jgi:hypothetical protein